MDMAVARRVELSFSYVFHLLPYLGTIATIVVILPQILGVVGGIGGLGLITMYLCWMSKNKNSPIIPVTDV